MHLRGVRIENFKGFSDSGWVPLGNPFTAVIGANNVGKTAFLEALRGWTSTSNPHRTVKRRRDQARPMQSEFSYRIVPNEHEVRDMLATANGSWPIPIPPELRAAPNQFIQKFLRGEDVCFGLKGGAGQTWSAIQYPSHGMFSRASNNDWFVTVTSDNGQVNSTNNANSASNDGAFERVPALLDRKIYVFRAERLNVAEVGFNEQKELSPDARNLPLVLLSLQTNPVAWERYNRHVNEVFSNVRRVVVHPKGGNAEIRLWTVDPASERDDLMVSLRDCGTGVGQVLAILYVAMTMEHGVIAIDEPNSFLHPGAAKALVRILSLYKNQYILATHSMELLAVAKPATTLLLTWVEGETKVEQLEVEVLEKRKELMSELGISAADVFGVSQVVWVEGPTEQLCFPLLAQARLGALPESAKFLSVRSADEVARSGRAARAIVDIYDRLSAAASFMPEALCFSLDREQRTKEEIERLTAEHKGAMRFLPARSYECFLVHDAALAAILSEDAKALGRPAVSESSVIEFLNGLREQWRIPEGADLRELQTWATVDSAGVLKAIFSHFNLTEYDKMRHGERLTRWLLLNDRRHLELLEGFVVSLLR